MTVGEEANAIPYLGCVLGICFLLAQHHVRSGQGDLLHAGRGGRGAAVCCEPLRRESAAGRSAGLLLAVEALLQAERHRQGGAARRRPRQAHAQVLVSGAGVHGHLFKLVADLAHLTFLRVPPPFRIHALAELLEPREFELEQHADQACHLGCHGQVGGSWKLLLCLLQGLSIEPVHFEGTDEYGAFCFEEDAFE